MAEYKTTTSEESLQVENMESQKVEKKFIKGCLFGCIGSTALLAIISSLIIPQFVYVKPNAEIGAVLNTMVNIAKTCVDRESEGLSTEFSDIRYLLDEYNRHTKAYKIEPYGVGNSCFNLVGKTEREWGGSDEENKYTWFSINVDPNTGLVTKKCGNSSALQCKKGNT